MTQNPEVSVVPTMADRELAEFIASQTRGYGVKLPKDEDTRVQAAARHRLAHQTPPANLVRDNSSELAHIRGDMVTPPATQPSATVGEDEDRTADEAVDFVFDRLAQKLGLAEWQVVEGSEEWEGDVSATLHRLLVDAGIIDDETGALATLHTPPPVATATVVDATGRLLIVTDDKGFVTLHEPNEDGEPGDLVASVWRDDWLPALAAASNNQENDQ